MRLVRDTQAQAITQVGSVSDFSQGFFLLAAKPEPRITLNEHKQYAMLRDSGAENLG